MGGYIGATAVGLTTTAADVQGDITSTDTTQEVILKNTTETDADGSRGGKITFKGEQTGGEESTLAQIQGSHDGTADDEKGDLIFKTNDGSDGASPTEAVRIDSGQTFLVGKTEDGFANAGHALFGGGDVYHIKDGDTALYLKRLSSNGDIAEFHVDSTQVGTIGASANDLTIFTPQSGHNGLRFHADGILPTDHTGAIIDNDAGLGISSHRFKNLYLSSGIDIDNGSIATASDNYVYSYSGGSSGQVRSGIKLEGSTNTLEFYTNQNERMRVSSSGNLLIGTDDSIIYNHNSTSDSGLVLVKDGYYSAARKNGPTAFLNRQASDGSIVDFYRDGSLKGTISITSSAVAYNTSSDYRLKENVTDISDGITRVKQLAPKRFNFIADADTTVDGFLAHEAQTVVPEAVTGIHDGVEVWKEHEELPDGVSVGDNKLDDDGNTIPDYQGIDQAKLVPLLTAALQEAIAKIETLETKVAALEGA